MISLQSFTIVLLACLSIGFAQQSEVSIQTPEPPRVIGPLVRPFHLERRIVAPAQLTDSPRLETLVRGGNLYLSAQDVIALVLEDNLDIAILRYGPFVAREVLRRAEGGGFLRAVDTPIVPGPVSVSLAGVSSNSSGLEVSTVGSGGGIVIQLGPTPPNLDPNLTAYAAFAHLTQPQTNTLLNQTAAFVDSSRLYQFAYQQQFVTGTSISASFLSQRHSVNSPVNSVNPYTLGDLDLQINQSLLQGFGRAVNNRNIRVAKNNIKVTDLQLRRQIITTVSAALNLYWDLVSFNDDVRIKQQSVAIAEKLYQDNQNMVKLGTLAGIEITRAAAEVSASKESLLIAQTNLAQQETVLKNALSRNGIGNPWLDEVHIIPLDHIEVPEIEEWGPTNQLINSALENRPEIEQSKINLQSSKINLRGTRNALLPTLSAFTELTNNGLSGAVNPLYNGCCGVPDPYVTGGYGNLVGQIFRRNFPNYSAGFSLNIPFRNRAAQADYVSDQLQLRQSELQLQRAMNQVRVDVKNAVIGLQQARARYQTAVNTRELAEQTLKAEQGRFQYGTAESAMVIQAQQDLALDQSMEIQAMANYTHAKIAFDQAVGQTLAVNRIALEEATSGHVARNSILPDSAPKRE